MLTAPKGRSVMTDPCIPHIPTAATLRRWAIWNRIHGAPKVAIDCVATPGPLPATPLAWAKPLAAAGIAAPLIAGAGYATYGLAAGGAGYGGAGAAGGDRGAVGAGVEFGPGGNSALAFVWPRAIQAPDRGIGSQGSPLTPTQAAGETWGSQAITAAGGSPVGRAVCR